jgi:hypothetical protein
MAIKPARTMMINPLATDRGPGMLSWMKQG